MDFDKLLNNEQLKAISTISKYTRIVAGAGSGKTRVLTYRIAYLISELHIDPRNILAIAFTNKVANEMKERIVKQIPHVAPYLHISTFHSFGVKFLRQEIHHLNFSRSFAIFDDDDTDHLIRDICVSRGYKKGDDIIKLARNYIAHKKCHGQYPSEVKLAGHYQEEECLEIFKEYEEKKSQMIALDFDDLLLLPIKILSEFKDVQARWQEKIRFILIDEFQDTNDVQFKLLKLLSNTSTSVYVVGDPDQTIYTWRGANQKIILDFEHYFPHAKTIILDQNYRSTKTILDAANKLIRNNKKRVEKNLFTDNLNGEKIDLFKAYTKDVEAEHVVTTIKKIVAVNNDDDLRRIAILYRSSYLTLPIEKALTKERIRYRVFGGVRFYQRKEIKDALAYFRIITNSKDDVSFERIVNVPKRKIGEKSIIDLKREAKSAGCSMLEYIGRIHENETELQPRVIMQLKALNDEIIHVQDQLACNDEIYSKVLEDFLIRIGYYTYLEEDENAEERLDNVKTLFADMFDFIKKNPEEGFQTWLDNCTLATSQDDMIDDNYVSLMTVHTAKGLEFDYVFVVGLAEGVFPNQRAVDEDERDGIEEERRLAYVAFTRAKKKLFLSMNSGFSFVNESNLVESRFIHEAGLKMPVDTRFSMHENYPRIKKSDLPSFRQNISYDENKFYDEPLMSVESNGVTSWHVGDRLHHDAFGDGVVTKVIDNAAIEVDFVMHGKKTMLSNHKMLKKINRLEEMN